VSNNNQIRPGKKINAYATANQITMADEDNWLKSNGTWIK
jgi:hypothetical protein